MSDSEKTADGINRLTSYDDDDEGEQKRKKEPTGLWPHCKAKTKKNFKSELRSTFSFLASLVCNQ